MANDAPCSLFVLPDSKTRMASCRKHMHAEEPQQVQTEEAREGSRTRGRVPVL